jgi:hypothetical protein
MDGLINALSKINVSFESSLDDLIAKMEKTDIEGDTDLNWKELSKNYAKLNYLLILIERHKPDHPRFFYSLNKFMNELDLVTQRYLKEINFDDIDNEYHQETLEFKDALENSLNTNDNTVKLKYLVEAYSIVVPIVEKLNESKVVLAVEPEFKKQFKRKRN